MLHQETSDGEAMLLHGEMERIRVVPFAADVGIGAALEQQLDSRLAVAEDGVVQRRSHALPATLVDERRMSIQQRIESREVTFSSGIAQTREGLRARAGRFKRLDMRLQCGPGRESIFARNHQLRIGKREQRRGELFFSLFLRQVSPAWMVLANAS
jgi:hypothetical protein